MTFRVPQHAAFIALVVAFSLSSCDCEDRDPGWELVEPLSEIVPTQDFGTTDFPVVIEPDVGPIDIVENVPLDHALNERTALVVDTNGTIWLAFHRCADRDCSSPVLTLARKPIEGDWSFESVFEQRGTFGLDLSSQDEPVLAFLVESDFSFKSARRTERNRFDVTTFGVRRSSIADGLDIARGGDDLFVTFANDRGDPVDAFVFDGEWRSTTSFDVGFSSAALERGLRANENETLYLIHQDGEFGAWGVAQFNPTSETWDRREYYRDETVNRPSSMVLLRDEICVSGLVDLQYLAVSCGPINDLERRRWDFPFEPTVGYSSMIAGENETLILAFNGIGNSELRVGRLSEETWRFDTLFDGNSYGVSTAVDASGDLVVSYYTCNAAQCSLQILTTPQSQLP